MTTHGCRLARPIVIVGATRATMEGQFATKVQAAARAWLRRPQPTKRPAPSCRRRRQSAALHAPMRAMTTHGCRLARPIVIVGATRATMEGQFATKVQAAAQAWLRRPQPTKRPAPSCRRRRQSAARHAPMRAMTTHGCRLARPIVIVGATRATMQGRFATKVQAAGLVEKL